MGQAGVVVLVVVLGHQVLETARERAAVVGDMGVSMRVHDRLVAVLVPTGLAASGVRIGLLCPTVALESHRFLLVSRGNLLPSQPVGRRGRVRETDRKSLAHAGVSG